MAANISLVCSVDWIPASEFLSALIITITRIVLPPKLFRFNSDSSGCWFSAEFVSIYASNEEQRNRHALSFFCFSPPATNGSHQHLGSLETGNVLPNTANGRLRRQSGDRRRRRNPGVESLRITRTESSDVSKRSSAQMNRFAELRRRREIDGYRRK